MTRHAQLVDDYHAARHADELARENADLGYATERAMRKADGARQPVTLRDWLTQAQEPKPSPEEEAAAWRVALVDAHTQVAIAGMAAETAQAVRDMTFHDAVTHGMSTRTIAAVLGISQQAVHNRIQKHRERV